MRWPNRNANGGFGSAIEALYTSKSPEHKGSLVAKERIKWFLGPNTAILSKATFKKVSHQSPRLSLTLWTICTNCETR